MVEQIMFVLLSLGGPQQFKCLDLDVSIHRIYYLSQVLKAKLCNYLCMVFGGAIVAIFLTLESNQSSPNI